MFEVKHAKGTSNLLLKGAVPGTNSMDVNSTVASRVKCACVRACKVVAEREHAKRAAGIQTCWSNGALPGTNSMGEYSTISSRLTCARVKACKVVAGKSNLLLEGCHAGYKQHGCEFDGALKVAMCMCERRQSCGRDSKPAARRVPCQVQTAWL